MKQILIILSLFASVSTFAQSPRIKLNQITKDTVKGSVLISSPTDSGMVYSRDLFISYGADTVLILGGDTLAATSSIISSVLSDGVTITGDGTTGSELTADTSVLATLRALSDSLALLISSVTADNVTITGDGTVGSPLKVDTLTVIATKGDLTDYVTVAGTQTITGAKTFSTGIVVNEDGNDVDTRFEGDTDANLLFLDANTNSVGIGTNTPSNKLHIYATDGLSYLRFTSNVATTGARIGYNSDVFRIDQQQNSDIELRTNNAERIRIKANGDVGIGTNTPSHPLEMGSGAHVTTGGVWTDASDIKLKTNINYIYPYGLEDIMNLKPTMFDYKNGEKNSLGFIAQDIYEIIPEAISSTIDINGNETMGVKMVSITATLVKAIQEQQAIIESQAFEIEQLKTLITELSNRLQILENN